MVRIAVLGVTALLLAAACGSTGGQQPAAQNQTPAAGSSAAPAQSGPEVTAAPPSPPAQVATPAPTAPAAPQVTTPAVGHYWMCAAPQNTLPNGSFPPSSTMCARLFSNLEPRAGQAIQLAAFAISPTPGGDYWSCDAQDGTNHPVTDIFISDLALANSGSSPGEVSAVESDPATAPTASEQFWSDPSGAAGQGRPLSAHQCGGP